MRLIKKREEIRLSESQLKIVRSGWGNEAVENTVVERITYFSDGLEIKGFLAYPKNREGKLPCVIWCRGGFGNKGKIDSFSARGIFGEIASWGYVVFASQYRSEELDEFGGADLNDVLNILPLAEEIDFADNENWGIEGWSRGGMMTYLALTKLNNFRAAIVVGGISNLRSMKNDEFLLKHFRQKFKEDNLAEVLEKFFNSRSIVEFPEKISANTALLIIHGSKDERVPVENSIEIAKKLDELKRKVKLVLLEDGDHFLKKYRAQVSELRKDWFQKYLTTGV